MKDVAAWKLRRHALVIRIVSQTYRTVWRELCCLQRCEDWQAGELIQNAMPNLDADSREQLISGTCPKCWDEMFGDPCPDFDYDGDDDDEYEDQDW